MITSSASRLTLLAITLLLVPALGCGMTSGLFATATPTPTFTPPPTHTPTITPTETPRPTKTPKPGTTPIEPSALLSESLGNGWTQYTIPPYNVSVQLPEDWVTLDFSPETLSNIADTIKTFGGDETIAALIDGLTNNPSIDPVLLAFEMNADGAETNFFTNANLIATSQTSGLPMESLILLVSEQLKAIYPSIEILDSGTRELASGETVGQLEYTASFEVQSGQTTDLHAYQIYLPTEDALLILTLSGPQEGFEEKHAELFFEIAESFGPVP